MRMSQAATSEGGSSSSTDTWAAKAASIAAALGSVLTAQPPLPKAKAALPSPPQPATGPAPSPPVPHFHQGPMFRAPFLPPPMHPAPVHPPTMHPAPMHPPPMHTAPMHPPPMHQFPPVHPGVNASTTNAQPVPAKSMPKASTTGSSLATLHDEWQLELRQCKVCKEWTYYKNGICVNKKCPLNQMLICTSCFKFHSQRWLNG